MLSRLRSRFRGPPLTHYPRRCRRYTRATCPSWRDFHPAKSSVGPATSYGCPPSESMIVLSDSRCRGSARTPRMRDGRGSGPGKKTRKPRTRLSQLRAPNLTGWGGRDPSLKKTTMTRIRMQMRMKKMKTKCHLSHALPPHKNASDHHHHHHHRYRDHQNGSRTPHDPQKESLSQSLWWRLRLDRPRLRSSSRHRLKPLVTLWPVVPRSHRTTRGRKRSLPVRRRARRHLTRRAQTCPSTVRIYQSGHLHAPVSPLQTHQRRRRLRGESKQQVRTPRTTLANSLDQNKDEKILFILL